MNPPTSSPRPAPSPEGNPFVGPVHLSFMDGDDDRAIDLLVEWDEQLRAGTPIPQGTFSAARRANHSIGSSFACLSVLNRAWPAGSSAEATAPPRRIGRYLIEGRLGKGSFGVVFRGHDSELKRPVAVKVLQPACRTNAETQRRFEREARAVALLDHPQIVPVYDFAKDGTTTFMVSACCDGGTLKTWMERRTSPIGADAAASLVLHLALALDHAHSRGVLHRDLKPGNILLSIDDRSSSTPSEQQPDGTLPESGSDRRLVPRIADFGLAKLLEATDEQQTRTGTILGTTAYMAPEQLLGQRDEIGPSVDVYALGAILYELLTGKVPFAEVGRQQRICRCEIDEPAPLRRFRGDVPHDLEAICAACLHPVKRWRYATAAALADDLRRFLARQPTHSLELLTRSRMHGRRNARWVWPIVTCGIAMAGIGLYQTNKGRDGEPAERPVISAAEEDLSVIVDGATTEPAPDPDADARSRRLSEAHARIREDEYIGEMAHAYDDLVAGHLRVACHRLKKWAEPDPALFDPRGPEWYSMWQQVQSAEPFAKWQQPGGTVRAAAFSPDGRLVAVVDAGGYFTIRKAADGAPVLERTSHSSDLHAVRFTADGTLLALAGAGGDVALLETDSWNERRRIAAHKGTVSTLDFSPDGTRLATGSLEDGVRIWNRETGELLHETPERPILVRWKLDGKTLIVGVDRERMREWTPPAPITYVDTDANALRSIDPSSNGAFVVSNSDSRIIFEDRRHEPRKGTVHKLDRSSSPHPVATAADASVAAVGITDGTVDLRRMGPDPVNCFQYLRISTGTQVVTTLAFDALGTWMLSGADNGEVKLWSVAALPFEPRWICRFPAPTCESIAFSADSRHMVCAGNGPSVFTFDLESRTVVETAGPSEMQWKSVRSGPDGDALFAIERVGQTAMRIPAKGSLADAFRLSAGPAQAIAPSHDGRSLAIAEGDSAGEMLTIRLCDASTGTTQQVIDGIDPKLEWMEFSPDGQFLALIHPGRPLMLYEVSTRQRLLFDDLGTGRLRIAFSRAQPLLAVHSDQLGIKLLNLNDRTVAPLGTEESVFRNAEQMAFSPDGRFLALAMSQRRAVKHSGVCLVHLASRQMVGFLDAMGTPRLRIGFSPDGKYLGMVGGHQHSVNRTSAVVWKLDGSTESNFLEHF